MKTLFVPRNEKGAAMSRLFVRCFFMLVFLVSAFALVPVGDDAAAQPRDERVSPEVYDAVQTQEKVPVVIALQEPAALAGAPIDVPALRQQVAASQAGVLSVLTAADFELKYRYEAVPALAGDVTASGLEKLAGQADVLLVYPDRPVQGTLTQSVPLINADDVHARGYRGQNVYVAVLDTGLDTDHADLSDHLSFQECFLAGVAAPRCPDGTVRQSGAGAAEDDNGHGTNVTGIVTSKGTVAPLGVAPDARIGAYKVLNANGAGNISDVLAALNHIIVNHSEIKVINMSLGTYARYTGACDGQDPAMTTAINTLWANGVTTFASSGNGCDKNAMSLPACISKVLSTGAVYDANIGPFAWTEGCTCTDNPTAADKVACWSNSDTTLDLLAPGCKTTSTGLAGGQSIYCGTSQASPHAAGCAALMLSANPALTPATIETRLEAKGVLVADPGAAGRITPRIDCYAAIFRAGGVGGVQDLPDVAGSTDSGGSSLPYAIAGAAMGLVVLGAGGWYARRRWLS